jgi:osmotically-inducible protein OsmY
MANNQSNKYKVVWLDNISAKEETENAMKKSTDHPHAVVFSGLNDNEDISVEQDTEKWDKWHNDYNIYKGGVRYTKFVDTDKVKKQINEYSVNLSFDYPSGLVGIDYNIGAEGYYWYIGMSSQHEIDTVNDTNIVTALSSAGWHKFNTMENQEINGINYNVVADYRTTPMEFNEPGRYVIVLPAFMTEAGYVPMHDIADAELGNDEYSFKKEYITINGHAYVQYTGKDEQDSYAGILAKRK